MKHRPSISVNIRIPIPQAVHELIERTKYAFKKAAFKMRPYRCGVCNAAMAVRVPQYEHVFANGSRLLIENNAWNQPPICRACLINELSTKDWAPRFTRMHSEKYGESPRENYRFWSTKKCDVTGKKVRAYRDVEIFPYVDMLFCTSAWNYNYISKEAAIEALERGKIKTSRWGVWKKTKMAPMNEKGLFIDENGELL